MSEDFIAGWFGGCAGVLAGHPFDTIKVRLQCQNSRKPTYTGIINCFTSLIKNESVKGLYKGMASPMYGVALLNAVIFGTEGKIHSLLNNKDSIYSHVIAGAGAGFTQSFIACPIEVAKTRMQLQGAGYVPQQKMYKGSMDCLVKTFQREGVSGIYRGFMCTILRDITGFAVYFGAYAMYCKWIIDNSSDKTIGVAGHMLAGGFSGVTSWIPNYALDVINSRMKADGVDGPYKYSGYRDCIRQSIAREGYMWMYRGIWSCVLRGFPVNAATFGVVEICHRIFKQEKLLDINGSELVLLAAPAAHTKYGE